MAGNSGKEVGEAIGAIILGIVGGLALGAIIEAISKPKYPVCNQRLSGALRRLIQLLSSSMVFWFITTSLSLIFHLKGKRLRKWQV
jgi:hypothetical protein